MPLGYSIFEFFKFDPPFGRTKFEIKTWILPV